MKKLLVAGMTTVVAGAALALPIAAYAQTTHHYGTANGTSAGLRQGYGYQLSVESRAKALGMTAEQLTEALKTKTMDQLMTEKGVSYTTFQEKMRAAAQQRWQDRGLSSDEIKDRTTWQAERQATATHDGSGQNMGGYGHQNR